MVEQITKQNQSQHGSRAMELHEKTRNMLPCWIVHLRLCVHPNQPGNEERPEDDIDSQSSKRTKLLESMHASSECRKRFPCNQSLERRHRSEEERLPPFPGRLSRPWSAHRHKPGPAQQRSPI